MGLFSKKTYVCEQCGKEYERRINLLGNLCNECWDQQEKEKKELEKAIKGYKEYHEALFYKSITMENMRKILDHREELMEKYANSNEISEEELYLAGKNYKKLTDEEATNIVVRALKSSVKEEYGAGFTTKFFALTEYESVLIDAKDVFAVAYMTDCRAQSNSGEVLLCIVFTNDPYVPVFPMIYVVKKGMFEFSKSKEGRNAIASLMESQCPNLTYPVGDVHDLKKIIKQDGCVKGKLELKFMQDQISNALAGIGIFDSRNMRARFLPNTLNTLKHMGYIPEMEINSLLKMEEKSCQKYWNEIIDKILEA